MGNRYFYYLIAGTMLANIVGFVPRILIEQRMDGLVWAIFIGTFLGMAILYFYSELWDKFPGKTYAELLYKFTPKWFASSFTFITACIWFTSGFMFLLGFTFIARRFITPETSLTMIMLLFLLPLLFGCMMDSKRILYATEMILILVVPLMIIIFVRAYTSENLDWNSMKLPITYVAAMPSYFAIAAAGYSYDGVLNLAHFNKVFTKKRKIKKIMYTSIAILGIMNLVTASFIPIGINGIDGVGSINHPWILTSDSFRIEFGFFERIFFLFLLLFMAVAILVILHHWHVSYRFFAFILHFPKLKIRNKEIVPYLIILSFLTISLIGIHSIDEDMIFILAKWWFVCVQPLVTLHTIVLYYMYRRAKKR
ncbi:GerAB/ArcD/ProY family transporter [Salirhabdus salicampi]|uniref:GerAB/ArcD/ProY family transporter n=1 Tax=Salirhabdus salicampi TaxID=476102 RepID=UPI0020C50AAC|nr:GerAB/ArcD/ProY family transporter [Salirhabdus salicampi]MCP8615392.1 spore germination protein [Salirhabdus salicampi]